MGAVPAAGTIVQIPELLQPDSPFRVHMKSLRVTGILESYDLSSGFAHISYDCAQLLIDTNFLRDLHVQVGSLYQFIGELLVHSDHQMVLQARVGRNVDGLDLKLYDKALKMRRQFEEKLL